MRGVQKPFDEEDFLVDVFWLDIDSEYAEDHKYGDPAPRAGRR
jgi:alpha 1,3-glucosidase